MEPAQAIFKFLLLLLLLSGCTTIDYNNHVEGWPVLEEEVHVVSTPEMRDACGKYAGFGSVTLACAEIFFDGKLCKIWITEAGGWTEEHERQHCRGYEHLGSNAMKQMLARLKK